MKCLQPSIVTHLPSTYWRQSILYLETESPGRCDDIFHARKIVYETKQNWGKCTRLLNCLQDLKGNRYIYYKTREVRVPTSCLSLSFDIGTVIQLLWAFTYKLSSDIVVECPPPRKELFFINRRCSLYTNILPKKYLYIQLFLNLGLSANFWFWLYKFQVSSVLTNCWLAVAGLIFVDWDDSFLENLSNLYMGLQLFSGIVLWDFYFEYLVRSPSNIIYM